MKSISLALLILGCLLIVSCQPSAPTPPVAKIEAKELTIHGDTRIDNYYWLRERENPEVIKYLEDENAYAAAVMAHTEPLQEKLFEEIKGRIKQDDSSVPYQKSGYYYYTRYEDGKEYPIYCRKEGSLEAEEQIMIDVNVLAEGHGFCSVRGMEVSTNNELLAWAVDYQGRRKYTLKIKNLVTREDFEDTIPEVTGNVTWANDNKTLFYTKQDPETLRSFQIYRHVLGTDPAEDVLVFQEDDVTFGCFVFKTKSEKYIIIGSNQTLSTEYRYLDADSPEGEFTVIQPRERDHEYDVDHFEGDFYIRTNMDAENFRLMKTPVTATTKDNWTEVIPHREDVFLQSYEIFKDYLVLTERKEGLRHIRIIPWNGDGEHYLKFDEPAYLAYVSINPEFDTPILRYGYQSMTTPSSTFDYNMETRERELLKEVEVLGGFDKNNYITERLFAPAADGTMIPISLVYRKGLVKDGSQPALIYGYGSYGSSMEPRFSSSRISLLDRGFTFAMAHIRGGQEMGRHWYENGKLLRKKNTFTDFNDCARFLIDQKFTSADKLFAMGGSAGGLLMGAIINMEPELYKGVIAHVPWVDVITTMLDDSIPLTTSEYDEWGNPNDKEYYDYMLSYSPYDQVEAQDYPNMLVTTGLHDSQVQYFEPAKWVAKLRTMKTDNNRLLLKTNMEAGHGGASGRYQAYKEIALDYAFMLDLLGISE